MGTVKVEEDGIDLNPDVDFCTLGMFIIDEIHCGPPTKPVYDIIGGAGSYSALGARLFSSGSQSRAVGWIVDKGSDFPDSVEETIRSWETSCLFRQDLSRLTTRGWNGYDEFQSRAFRYATPKLRLDETALQQRTPLLRSKSFHLICSPTRCIDLVKSIIKLRKALPDSPPRPLFIWEPVPDLCVPEQILETTRALSYVDVCSPNHAELASLMDSPVTLPNGDIDRQFIESATEQLLGSMPLTSFAIVVRCGKEGCYIGKNGSGIRRRVFATKKRRFTNKRAVHPRGGLNANTDFADLFARLTSHSDVESEESDEEPDWGVWTWLPAYHEDQARVVDPTGGGNAFLGGLAVALARGHKLEKAVRHGIISASYAIEQVGMPTLVIDDRDTGQELWNGDTPGDRLRAYGARLDGKINPQMSNGVLN